MFRLRDIIDFTGFCNTFDGWVTGGAPVRRRRKVLQKPVHSAIPRITESTDFYNTFDGRVTGGGQVNHLPAAGVPTVKCVTKTNRN